MRREDDARRYRIPHGPSVILARPLTRALPHTSKNLMIYKRPPQVSPTHPCKKNTSQTYLLIRNAHSDPRPTRRQRATPNSPSHTRTTNESKRRERMNSNTILQSFLLPIIIPIPIRTAAQSHVRGTGVRGDGECGRVGRRPVGVLIRVGVEV